MPPFFVGFPRRIPAALGLLLCLALPATAAADNDWYFQLPKVKDAAAKFAIGTAAMPGMTAAQAVYVKANADAGSRVGAVAIRSYDAKALRGHRVQITLHLQN